MENNNAQNLAEQIAFILQKNEKGNDALSRASLENINQRLDRIESQISVGKSSFQISNPKSSHSSQEKFTNLENLAVETISGSQNEKACPYEPTGKPCDDCAMCSSRGF